MEITAGLNKNQKEAVETLDGNFSRNLCEDFTAQR